MSSKNQVFKMCDICRKFYPYDRSEEGWFILVKKDRKRLWICENCVAGLMPAEDEWRYDHG